MMRIAVSEFYFKEFHGFLEMEDKFHCLGLKFEENKISILSARNHSSALKYNIDSGSIFVFRFLQKVRIGQIE